MAIPTISNNVPSAGHISWGAFNIQLNGVTYSVGAGSTDQRWVWWKYNAGAPTITAGPDVPTTLVDDDLVLFANKNGIGVRVQSTNFVDGELLVDGSIFAEALSTNLINSQHIVTAGLDAGVIKFGTMNGDRIGVNTLQGDRILAGSIVASKMAITDWENYVPDPYFTLGRWTLPNGIAIAGVSDLPLAIGAGNVLRYDAGVATTLTAFTTDKFATTPAEPLRIAVWVRKITAAATPTGTVDIRLRYYDGAGVNATPFYLSANKTTASMVQNTWYELVIENSVPVNRVSSRLDLLAVGVNAGDDFEFAIPQVNKKANGRLIVDGTITATKIGTGEITALQIKGDTITANEIAADSITADEIAGKTITANEIAGGTITAAEILTGSISADKIAASAITSEHLKGKFIEGATLDIEDSIHAEPGFLDISANLMEAQSAIFHDNVTRRGLNNYMEGRETASSGVTDPGTPPTVSNVWPFVQTAVSGSLGGMAVLANGTEFAAVFPGTSTGTMVLSIYNLSTGAWVRDLATGSTGSKTIYDMCRAGDWYYTLEGDNGVSTIVCRRYDARPGATEGVRDTTYQFTALDDRYALANPGAMGITSNGTDIFMVYLNQSGRWRIREQTIASKTNLTTASYTSLPTDINPTNGTMAGLAGLDVTTTTFDNVYIQPYHGTQVFVGNSTGVWTTSSTSQRVLPYDRTVVASDGQKTIDVDGRLYTHSTSYVGTRPYTYTWYDGDSAGAGVAESKASPARNFLIARGAHVNIKTPMPPDDGSVDAPNTVKVYIDNYPQGAPYTDTELATGRTLSAPVWSGSPSPTTSGFASRPQTLPGGYKSTGGDVVGPYWWYYGNGEGRAGPLRWDGLGQILNTPLPLGTIQMFAGPTAPTGFLLCQGQAVSRTTYAALYAVIGTTYGPGDSSTTFNLPDMRGRYPFGAGASIVKTTIGETEVTNAGATPGMADGGRLDHRHTHVVDTHDHGLGAGTTAAVPSGSGGGQRMTGAGVTGGRSPGTNSRGVGDQPNDNIAYHGTLVLNFIIKALT